MSLASIPSNGKVAVIGAGVSGLSLAYFLLKLRPDVNIEIFEKESRVGGWIKSENLQIGSGSQTQKLIFEKGPRTLRGVSPGTLLIVDILKQLNKAAEIEVITKTSPANKKYILSESRGILQVPDSIGSFFKFLFNSGLFNSQLVFGILKEPFRKKGPAGDESIDSFFLRRFGTGVLTNNVVSAVMHGIVAGDTAHLSINTMFPKLKQLEQEHGSIIRGMVARAWASRKKAQEVLADENVPKALQLYEKYISPEAHLDKMSISLKKYPMIRLNDGLEGFPASVYEYLAQQKKVNFNFNSDIVALDPEKGSITFKNSSTAVFDHINTSTSANVLTKILPKTSAYDEVKRSLASIPYVSVFLVNIYTPSGKLIPKNNHGFGFLVPKLSGNIDSNPDLLLGVIFDSDVEKNSVQMLTFATSPHINEGYSKITLMMGGHYYNDFLIPSNSRNLKIVKGLLSKYLDIDIDNYNFILRDEATLDDKKIGLLTENDILISYNLHEKCIPQYTVGYNEAKETTLGVLEKLNSKLSFGGTLFGAGIGVPDAVSNGLEIALKLK